MKVCPECLVRTRRVDPDSRPKLRLFSFLSNCLVAEYGLGSRNPRRYHSTIAAISIVGLEL